MALNIRQLNGDASFLLTFEPIEPDATEGADPVEPFRVLLDPWLTGPSNTKFSSTTHTLGACVSTLQELPEPDLVIISNSRSDHCHEGTLRQLPPRGTKTYILAEPTAAKLIQNWRYFDQDKILTLQRWQDPRQKGLDTAIRVPIPARVLGGDEGQVTVSFIAQRKDTKGRQSAVGITYRPAPSARSISRRPAVSTSPTTLFTSSSGFATRMPSVSNLSALQTLTLPPLPAFTPLSPPASPGLRTLRPARSIASLSPHARDRGVSVIFSPNGISYRTLEQYATSHLVAEAALPLTALLHCFDTVSQPWWLGGNVTSGFHDGQEIVAKLGARAWISTYDGEKNVSGLSKRLIRRRKHNTDEVRHYVQGAAVSVELGEKPGSRHGGKMDKPTEILALGVGEEVTLTSEGIWEAETPSPVDSKRLSIRHILHTTSSRESMGFMRMSKHWPLATAA